MSIPVRKHLGSINLVLLQTLTCHHESSLILEASEQGLGMWPITMPQVTSSFSTIMRMYIYIYFIQ